MAQGMIEETIQIHVRIHTDKQNISFACSPLQKTIRFIYVAAMKLYILRSAVIMIIERVADACSSGAMLA